MRSGIFIPIVIATSLATTRAEASCSVEYETVIRGRLVRCESAQFYWNASGADRAIQESLDQALSATAPQSRDRLMERLRQQQLLPGSRQPQSPLVAVVLVDWQAST